MPVASHVIKANEQSARARRSSAVESLPEARERQRARHASGAGQGARASKRVRESGPPSPRSGVGAVSPEPASKHQRANADGAEPPGQR
jgi:hypothetical protein